MVPPDRIAKRTLTSLLQSRRHRLCHGSPIIRQSYAAVFETEQSPPRISVSLACEVTLQMKWIVHLRSPFSSSRSAISHTLWRVTRPLLGPSLADLLSVKHLCNGHVSFVPLMSQIFSFVTGLSHVSCWHETHHDVDSLNDVQTGVPRSDLRRFQRKRQSR